MGQYFHFERHLERDRSSWESVRTPDVNDPPSVYFEPVAGSDGQTMVLVNAGDRKFAGGLIAHKKPVPKRDGVMLQFIAMHIGFRYPAWSYRNLARHELDLKVCFKTRPNENTPIRNVANFSTQWNRDTGQMQLDKDPPKWLDSGMVVLDMLPDEWHDLDYRFHFNPHSAVFSVDLIAYDGDVYEVPEEFADVPAQLTNWEEVRAVQIQNEMFEPGVTEIEYSDISLAWSDQEIGPMAWW